MTPEQTLDWLAQQHWDQCREDRPIQDWIRKMKSQLPAQPKQEPAAVYVGETWCGSVVRLYEDLPLETPFYTTPLQRTWVGLPDDIKEAVLRWNSRTNIINYVEEWLKEKNT